MSIVADWTEDFSGALQCAANGFAISHTPDDRQPPGPGQFTARVWVNEAANGLRPILPNTGCILEMTEPKACAAFGCNHAAAAGGLCAGCHVKYRSHYWRMERLMRRAQKLMSKVREEDFADYLVARGYDSGVVGPSEFFSDVWYLMHKRAPPPPRICAECGNDSADRLYDRTDSRYCSAKCRQKAYRKRVTDKASPGTAKRNGVTDRLGD
jgi:hypothetical protein